MEFWRLYRLVYAKRWLILAIMLTAACVIFIGSLLQGHRNWYQATAQIQPNERRFTAAPAETDTHTAAHSRQDVVSGLITTLRSNSALRFKTAELLSLPEEERSARVAAVLDRNGTFTHQEGLIASAVEKEIEEGRLPVAEGREKIRQDIAALHKNYADALSQARDDKGSLWMEGIRDKEKLNKLLRDNLTFEPVEGPLSTENTRDITSVINIQATDGREAGAELLANMVCVALIDYHIEKGKESFGAQKKQLTAKRQDQQKKLDQAQKELLAYQRRPEVVALNPDQAAGTSLAVKYGADRNALQAEVDAARQEVSQATAALSNERPTTTREMPAAEDAFVRSLVADVARAKIEFDKVAAAKMENHPDYKAAREAWTAAQNQLNAARSRNTTVTTPNPLWDTYKDRLTQAQTRLRGAQAKLLTTERQLAQEQAKVANLPAAQARLTELRKRVALYDKAVSQIDEQLTQIDLKMSEQDLAGTLAIASQADARPMGGTKSRGTLIVYGMILALIFGVALVIAMDALDNSIRDTSDVEKLLGLPICGIIPAQLPDPNRAPRITYLDPLSPVSEAYRLLRTDLLFTAQDRPFKSLLLATGKPGQGATTTVCNLAISLAQAGKRVILVDADLRRPRLHTIFNTTNDVGLTSLLTDGCEIEEALKATEIDNLLLLPSGPLPLNPSELLASPRMRALHEQLKPHTDYILFDTPSAIAFSDCTVLSSFVDAALMVIRASNVPRGSELQVKSMLTKARANILGVVLNGMNPDRVDSVHYHYHYYPVLTTNGPVGALGSGNGNGHHGAAALPLALPGEGGTMPQPVATAAAASASASESSAPVLANPSSGVGDKTISFISPVQAGRVAPAPPFVEPHQQSFWKRAKAAAPWIALAVAIAVLVLLLNSSVGPAARP